MTQLSKLLIGGLIAIAVFVVVWRYVQPPVATTAVPVADLVDQAITDEANAATISTEDWDTYSSDKFEYLFKYPEDDWHFVSASGEEDPDPDADHISFTVNDHPQASFRIEASTVDERPYPCDTLEECAEVYRQTFGQEQVTSGLVKRKLGGRDILTETITNPTTGLIYRVYYLHDETCIETLITAARAADDQTVKPVFDAALNSFLFFDPAAVSQNYSSPAGDYSLHYPSNWAAQQVDDQTVRLWNDPGYASQGGNAATWQPTEHLYYFAVERDGPTQDDISKQPGLTVVNTKDIKVGGQPATKVTYSQDSQESVMIFVRRGQTNYTITIPTVTRDARYTGVQILATFTFGASIAE